MSETLRPGDGDGPAAKVDILIVDDNRQNLLALEAVLAGLGHNIVLAESGEEALRRLLERDFAVILLDVRMPGLDGFETAALIRRRERSQATPIMFLTAVDKNPANVYKGYLAGAVDYILKPIPPEVLKSKVSVFVEMHLRRERIKAEGERRLVDEQAEHDRRLARVQAQRQRFFTLSHDMLCITGFDGTLREINPAWSRTLGLDEGDLTAAPFFERIHPDDQEATRLWWRRIQHGAGHAAFVSRFRAGDGGWRWLAWSATTSPEDQAVYAAVRDITDWKKAEESLKESERRYRDLFENASDLIQIAAPDGRILYANHAWLRALEYEPEDLPLIDFADLVPPERREASSDAVRRVVFEPGAVDLETEFVTRSGRRIAIEGTLSCQFVDAHPVCVRGIFRDVTQKRQVDRLKSEFIAITSHELRTPLTSIQGSLALIATGVAGDLPPRARELLEIAHKNSERLGRLVHDILDIEKIESGRMEFRIEPIDAAAVARAAILDNEPFASQSGVACVLEEPPQRLKIRADGDRLHQVLANLLANAIKFSPEGGTVTVAVERHGDSIRMGVHDAGPGVPDEFRARIFQKFAQADSTDRRRQSGSGLGLSIAKALVEKIGGRIGFESRPGSTRFYVDLPECRDQAPLQISGTPEIPLTAPPGPVPDTV